MIRQGTDVKWKWGDGFAKGEVQETYTKSVTKTIEGSEITRNGSENNKALWIQQNDGTRVLKLESEVERND